MGEARDLVVDQLGEQRLAGVVRLLGCETAKHDFDVAELLADRVDLDVERGCVARECGQVAL